MVSGIVSLISLSDLSLLVFRIIRDFYVCLYLATLWNSLFSLGFPNDDGGLIPGSERTLGVGNGNLLQYSCLENSMDREAWQAIDHEVTKSQTWLIPCARVHTHTCTHTCTCTHTHTHTHKLLSSPRLSSYQSSDPFGWSLTHFA